VGLFAIFLGSVAELCCFDRAKVGYGTSLIFDVDVESDKALSLFYYRDLMHMD
jgi:hypothetical protein